MGRGIGLTLSSLSRDQGLAGQALKVQVVGFAGLRGARGHVFWGDWATSNENGAFCSSRVRTRLGVGITGDTLSWSLS